VARTWLESLADPLAARCLTHLAAWTVGTHPSPSSSASTKAGIPSDELTAYGTLALAALTLITLVTTIIISWRDSRRLRVERQEAQDLESLGEAYSVQVIGTATTVIVNHGKYTISGVEARLRLNDGNLIEFSSTTRVLDTQNVPSDLRADSSMSLESISRPNILTPWDIGLRFVKDPAEINGLIDAYPVVRWRDRWGRWWEHRLGNVKIIKPSTPWSSDLSLARLAVDAQKYVKRIYRQVHLYAHVQYILFGMYSRLCDTLRDTLARGSIWCPNYSMAGRTLRGREAKDG
jgi:hypothetical protein